MLGNYGLNTRKAGFKSRPCFYYVYWGPPMLNQNPFTPTLKYRHSSQFGTGSTVIKRLIVTIKDAPIQLLEFEALKSSLGHLIQLTVVHPGGSHRLGHTSKRQIWGFCGILQANIYLIIFQTIQIMDPTVNGVYQVCII